MMSQIGMTSSDHVTHKLVGISTHGVRVAGCDAPRARVGTWESSESESDALCYGWCVEVRVEVSDDVFD